jgi:MFS family permease
MDESRPLRGRVVLASGATAVVSESDETDSTISIEFRHRSVGTVVTPTVDATYQEIDRLRALFARHRPVTVEEARELTHNYIAERGYPADGPGTIRAVPTPQKTSKFAFFTAAEYLDFRRLLWARLGSTLGTWSALFALNVVIYNKTHSAVWVSALLIIEFLPSAALSLTIGPIVDRQPRQRLMIVSDLGGVLVFCLMPFAHTPLHICLLAGFAGCAAALFRPGAYSGVPNLVPPEVLPEANSLLQGSENLTRLMAPFVGGAILALTHPTVVYALNAASFAFSAYLLYRLGPGKLEDSSAREVPSKYRGEIAAGLRRIQGDRVLRVIFGVWAVGTFAFGAQNVSEVLLAKDSNGYGASTLGFAVFVAASGAGIVVGNLIASSVIRRVGAYWGYVLAFTVLAAGIGLCAISPGVALGSVGAVVYGIGNGVGLVCNVTLIQETVEDRMRGRTFAFLGTLVQISMLVGMIVSGPFTDRYGPRWTWAACSFILALAALNAVRVTLRERRRFEGLPV